MTGLTYVVPATRERLPIFYRYLTSEFEFYRVRFADAGVSPDDDPIEVLDSIAPLSPSDYLRLRDHAVDRLADAQFLIDRTSGTTGPHKLRIATRRDDEAEAIVCERFFRACGLSPSDRVLALDIDSSSIYLFYGRVLQRIGVEHFAFSSIGIPTRPVLHTIYAFRPTAILSVPSVVRTVLRPDGKGHPPALPSLRRAILIGEPISDTLRSYLITAYGCESYSFYGTTEIGSVAGECTEHSGMHLNDDLVFPSVRVASRTPLTIDGEVFWTTLHFVDQPLLLYPTNDVLTIRFDPCHCGNDRPRITSVHRAHDEIVIYGYKIPYETFRETVATFLPVTGFLQLSIREDPPGYHILFRLPSELAAQRDQLINLLTNVADLPYFIQRGLVQCQFKFADEPIRVGRKARNIVPWRLLDETTLSFVFWM